jgi:hypothetical protein
MLSNVGVGIFYLLRGSERKRLFHRGDAKTQRSRSEEAAMIFYYCSKVIIRGINNLQR